MKNLIIIFLAIMTFGMTSCGSDAPADLVPGTWTLTSSVTTSCTTEDENFTIDFGDAGCEELDGSTICFEGSWTITAPGTIAEQTTITEDGVVQDDTSSTGTYSFSTDNDSEMTICFDGECIVGTVTVTETSLTWVGAADVDGCVTTINATK